jgi:hypothetical protein
MERDGLNEHNQTHSCHFPSRRGKNSRQRYLLKECVHNYIQFDPVGNSIIDSLCTNHDRFVKDKNIFFFKCQTLNILREIQRRVLEIRIFGIIFGFSSYF